MFIINEEQIKVMACCTQTNSLDIYMFRDFIMHISMPFFLISFEQADRRSRIAALLYMPLWAISRVSFWTGMLICALL